MGLWLESAEPMALPCPRTYAGLLRVVPGVLMKVVACFARASSPVLAHKKANLLTPTEN